MKRLLTGALALIFSIAASATTLNPIQLLNPTGSTSGQAIVSTGASTAPAWSNVAATALAAQAANTVVANATGSSASPTAFPVPSCSTSASALDWTSGTGFTCNTAINAAQLGGNAIGTSGATIPLLNGANTWGAAQTFSTLSATGAITPSQTAGIVGTTTNNNATAGSVGEYASNSTTGTSVTSNTPLNCASVTLTAGDWDVWGTLQFNPTGITSWGQFWASTNSTSATLGTNDNTFSLAATLVATSSARFQAPIARYSLASTTTVYLVGQALFSGGTVTCDGFIKARRVR